VLSACRLIVLCPSLKPIDIDLAIGEYKANMPASALALQTSNRWGAAVTPCAHIEEKQVDSLQFSLGEIPRGALTEIAGPASSGRTSYLYALLAAATAEQEYCALIDAENAFDPLTAARAGVRLSQVLWIRCTSNIEHALKAADWLSQAGGFGLVAIDFGDIPMEAVRRVPLAAWFRLRHNIENKPVALVSIAQQIHAHTCSTLKIQLQRRETLWRHDLLSELKTSAGQVMNHRRKEKTLSIPVSLFCRTPKNRVLNIDNLRYRAYVGTGLS
jgi:hypothetical protein